MIMNKNHCDICDKEEATLYWLSPFFAVCATCRDHLTCWDCKYMQTVEDEEYFICTKTDAEYDTVLDDIICHYFNHEEDE